MGDLMRQADGQQHMGWIQRSGGAGRTTGSTDPLAVQQDQKRLSFNKLEAEVGIVGKPVRGMSVKPAVGDLRQHPVDQVIPQPGLLPAPRFHGVSRKAGRRPKPYDARHIFRSCPALPLLAAPVDKGPDLHTFADIKENSPDSVLIAVNGDIVDEANAAFYDRFYESYSAVYGEEGTQMLVGLGNHEFIVQSENDRYDGVSEAELARRYEERLALWKQKTGNDSPYFAREIEGSWFIFLGTTAMPR